MPSAAAGRGLTLEPDTRRGLHDEHRRHDRREGRAVALSAPRRSIVVAAPRAVRRRTPRADRYLNRELSWLEFERRVLRLAADPGVPLLERAKLCAIVASNLDEFFAVRIAGLLGRVQAGVPAPTPDGRSPRETLADCRDRIASSRRSRRRSGWTSSAPRSPPRRSACCRSTSAGRASVRPSRGASDLEIEPLLTPIAVGAAAPFPLCPLARAERRRARARPAHA